MNTVEIIHVIKVLVAFAFLLEASRRDLKSRIVENELWLYMLLTLLPLCFLEYFLSPFNLLFAAAQAVFVIAFSYAVYWLGLYGGADAKALMVLAITFPVYPSFYVFPVLGKGMGMFAFSTLANSVIVAPLLVILLFVKNVLKGDLELPYCLIGYREKLENIKFHNLLEYVEGKKVVKRFKGIEADEKELEKLKKAGVREVWVSPALPFICFITAGFLVAVFVGNLLYVFIKAILS